MKLIANAKINLTLDIVGSRADGYHLLDSVFQSISLFDEVYIEKSEQISVAFSNATISPENSVVYKTALAFFEFTGIKSGARIRIQNNIPTSSGMGGGSSNAAAVLTGLNALFGTNLRTDELIKISASLGADIPFCLVGGTSRVTGIGEKVSPLQFPGDYSLLIIKDASKPSTAEMYASLDKSPRLPPKTDELIAAINTFDKERFLSGISNAFNTVCDISAEERALKGCGALSAGLTGSGPSVFGIFDNERTRDEAFRQLKATHNCYKAGFSPFGIKIV